MILIKKNITYIDGYNVINKWTSLREISKSNLSLSRDTLIEEMAEYGVLAGKSIIIVFDAYNLDRIKETIEEKYGMKIVYTKRFQTADTYIEKEMAKNARNHNVTVVTDDGAVQNMALSKGASRMTALELKADLASLRAKIRKKKQKDFSRNFSAYPISKELKRKLDQIDLDLDD